MRLENTSFRHSQLSVPDIWDATDLARKCDVHHLLGFSSQADSERDADHGILRQRKSRQKSV